MLMMFVLVSIQDLEAHMYTGEHIVDLTRTQQFASTPLSSREN